MALPASVPTGTVTGTWYTPSGSLAVGTIVFLLLESIEVPDDPDGVVIPVKTIVDIPAGVLARTLPAGMYQVSVRLSELYRITKVIEIEAGVALNLPDAVGLLLPDPDLYDPVRSVNGVFPDAYGNIVISGGGGGGAVDSVFGRTGVVVAANGDYTKAQVGLSNVDNTTDLAKPISTATQAALDGKQASGSYATTSDLTTGLATKQDVGDYATNTALTSGLATKAATVHTHTIAEVTSLQATLDAKALATDVTAVRPRTLIVNDKSQPLGVDYFPMPDTSSAWTLFSLPGEYSVAAAAGEYIEVSYNVLVNSATNCFTDLVVVTGGTPTIQRYLASNSATPSFQGSSGDYTDGGGAALQGRSGTFGFIAGAGDIDAGSVRIRWAIKTASGTGRLYAAPNYPLSLIVKNLRTPL